MLSTVGGDTKISKVDLSTKIYRLVLTGKFRTSYNLRQSVVLEV